MNDSVKQQGALLEGDMDQDPGWEDRKLAMTSRLQQRHDARAIETQRLHEEREEQKVHVEQSEHFAQNMKQESDMIQEALKQASILERNEALSKMDEVTVMLQRLQKMVAESVMFLPTYQVRKAQDKLKELHQQLASCHDTIAPRKKFGFKKRQPKNSVVKKDDSKPLKTVSHSVNISETIKIPEYGFNDQSDAVLTLDDVTNRDVTLIRLERCVVRLKGAAGSVRLTASRNCIILLGPVSSSVFLDDCHHCHLVAACQQLRAHQSSDCHLYLHVTSRAIIENCQRIKVAPYNLTYPNIDSDFVVARLDRSKNNWNDVDDFNWLSRNTPSPNWSVLPEKDRIRNWDEANEKNILQMIEKITGEQ